jgi:hypothetical protein
MNFNNIKLGTNYPFHTTVKTIMADTGTSLNMVPDVDFNNFKKYLTGLGHDTANSCTVLKNTLTSCSCTSAGHDLVQDINFDIDGITYKIPRDMWYERSNKTNTCIIKFMHAAGRD